MVKIDISYPGDLRCEATHGPSANRLITDAPADNMGKGEAFSPTDLVATALGTCMITTMGIVAQRNGLDLRGSSAIVQKEMVVTPTRRIGRLIVDITVPGEFSAEDRQRLEHAAHSCPVHKSLGADVEIPVTFHWGK